MNLRRAAGALILLAALPLGACSGTDTTTTLHLDSEPGSATATKTTASVLPPTTAAPSASASRSASASARVAPELQLLRRLQALSTAEWPRLRDARTGTAFALPAVVPEVRRTTNGVAQRIYSYEVTKQTGITVSFARAPSPAAAAALLPIYGDQLKAGFRAVGSDDAASSEERRTTIDGNPAITFRFSFTPTTVPQIPPVWLVTAIAKGANLLVLQTIVFPSSSDYDYLRPARRIEQRLVRSLDG